MNISTQKPKVVAIVQARMGSARLSRKVLQDINGKPLLWHVMRRACAAKLVDEVILATAHNEENHPIADFAKQHGFQCYAGAEADLLDRFYQPCKQHKADIVVRITGDNPAVDPALIDRAVQYFIDHAADIDYVSTNRPHKLPHGLDVEVFSMALLETLWQEVKGDFEREWFVTVIWAQPERWRMGDMNLESVPDLDRHRWTVDFPADLALMRQIFAALDSPDRIFGYKDILALFAQRPELYDINESRHGAAPAAGIEEARNKAGAA